MLTQNERALTLSSRILYPRVDPRGGVPPAHGCSGRADRCGAAAGRAQGLGGLEAQELQLRSLAFTAFRARTLSRGDELLYLTATIEVTSYVARDDGDLTLFYEHLRDRYGADTQAQRRANRLSAAIAVIDPLFLFSLYGYWYR